MDGGNFRPKTTPAEQPKRDHIWQVPAPVVAVLVVLFAVQLIPPLIYGDWEARRLALFAFSPIRFVSAAAINQPPGAAYYTMLTHGLLHANLFHLFTNSVWLLIFGTPVARVLGGLRFLLILAGSTIAGALMALVVDWGQFVMLVGASGGISGLVAAAMPVIFSQDTRSFSQTAAKLEDFSVLPFSQLLRNYRALWFIAVWLSFTFFTGAAQFILPTAFLSETKVAWEAHLGGFLAGFALLYLLAPRTVSKP